MVKFSFAKGQKIAQKAVDLLLDLVFPKTCAGCDQEGTFLCQKCARQIPIFDFALCPRCHRKISFPLRVCRPCRKKTVLKFLIAPTVYEHPTVKNLIAYFKYNRAIKVAETFLPWLLQATAKFNFEDFLVVPVPLHKKKLRQRGFNQAQILTQAFAQRKNLKWKNVLQRTRAGKAQVELKGKERELNVADAFRCFDQLAVAKRKILLIDDVFTTGATLNECAKALKKAGAREVWALTIAR